MLFADFAHLKISGNKIDVSLTPHLRFCINLLIYLYV